MKIKRVIREDLPETNSSSSHSVVISMKSEENLDMSKWGLNIDENTQILYIPTFFGFGREFFCSNSTLVKLQYLSCYFIRGPLEKKVFISKQIYKFKEVLKDILGIKRVVFEEAIDFWKRLNEGNIDEEVIGYYEFPTIDWQSLDLKSEILESKETIKNFLLNPNSWIYGGDDCDDAFSSRYSDTQITPEVIGYYSVELNGIGRVDIEVTQLSDIEHELYRVLLNFYCKEDGKFLVSGDDYKVNLKTVYEYIGFDRETFSVIFGNNKTDESIKIHIPLKFTIYDISRFSI